MITADVAVVGAGVQGASTAFSLTERGVANVAVFDKAFVGAGATGKSSAVIRVYAPNMLEVKLISESYKWFMDWENRVGGDCGFVRTGWLRIVPEGEVAKLRGCVAMVRSVGIAAYEMDATQVKEIAPEFAVGDIVLAGYEPDAGYADPWSATHALMAAARRRGAQLFQGVEVLGIEVKGHRVVGLQTTAGAVSAPTVVVANNAWAPRLLGTLGIAVPIVPTLYQVAVFHRPPAVGRHVSCTDGSLGIYLRMEGQHMTLVGTSTGIAHVDPDNVPDHPASDFWADVAERISRRIPAMADATSGKGMTGIYDMTPDHEPLLGPIPGYDGLYIQAGFSGAGFKTGPAVGQVMAELITTGASTLIDWHLLRLTRFAEGSPLVGDFDHLVATEVSKIPWP